MIQDEARVLYLHWLLKSRSATCLALLLLSKAKKRKGNEFYMIWAREMESMVEVEGRFLPLNSASLRNWQVIKKSRCVSAALVLQKKHTCVLQFRHILSKCCDLPGNFKWSRACFECIAGLYLDSTSRFLIIVCVLAVPKILLQTMVHLLARSCITRHSESFIPVIRGLWSFRVSFPVYKFVFLLCVLLWLCSWHKFFISADNWRHYNQVRHTTYNTPWFVKRWYEYLSPRFKPSAMLPQCFQVVLSQKPAVICQCS